MVGDMLLSLALTLALAADLPRELSGAAGCSDERPCLLNATYKADADGVALKVFHVGRGTKELEAGAECDVEEYWLVTGKKDPSPKLLLQLCNDGYGGAGIGEDDVQVKPNRLSHEQIGGGSESRWFVHRELQLNPPQLLTTTVGTFPSAAPKFIDESKWQWDTSSGERTRFLSLCTEEGHADLREDVKPKAVRSAMIPKAVVTKAFVEGGWKTTALGSCAAKATWPIQGAAGTDQDSSLKVMAINDSELVIELVDDVYGPGDQLQLWLGERTVSPLDGCLGKQGLQAAQWLIDVPSGKGRAGHNARFGTPVSEVVQQGQVVRLRMKFPEGQWPSVMIAYADSDDGKLVERVMGTSQFVFAQMATLGAIATLERKMGICDVVDGALQFKRNASLPSKGPLFPGNTKGKW